MKKILIALLAVAFVGAMAMPAMAQDKAEWSFYGSARVKTFSYDDDKMSGLAPNPGVNGFDDRDTVWSMQGTSRFGANVSAGDISGRVEIRETDEFRVMWGEWDFGAGKLGIGKNYTPVNMFYSQQAAYDEIAMLNTGGLYTGADGMIRFRFQGLADMIDLDFALIEPGTSNEWENSAAADFSTNFTGINTDTDYTLPQIEARMLVNWGALQAEFNGGWVEFEETAIVGGAERTYDLEGWILAMGLKYAMGPFYANGNIHTGENNSLLGQFLFDAAMPQYDAVNDTIVDRDHWGWHLVAGFNVNDLLALEAGYGENQMEPNQQNLIDDEVAAYYLQARVTPAKGLVIIPEIGKRDYKNDINGNDEGDSVYFGAVWKISF